jgi:hypothetical protein
VKVDAARFFGFTGLFFAVWASHASAHPAAASALRLLTGH